MDLIKEHIKTKITELDQRLTNVIIDLQDEDLNWRPNKESNSIANLAMHMSGHIHQRIGAGMMNETDHRDRDAEFSQELYVEKEEIIDTVHSSFSRFSQAVESLSEKDLLNTQILSGNRVQSNLEIILRCLEHYSEHLGQIIYIAKMKKDEQ